MSTYRLGILPVCLLFLFTYFLFSASHSFPDSFLYFLFFFFSASTRKPVLFSLVKYFSFLFFYFILFSPPFASLIPSRHFFFLHLYSIRVSLFSSFLFMFLFFSPLLFMLLFFSFFSYAPSIQLFSLLPQMTHTSTLPFFHAFTSVFIVFPYIIFLVSPLPALKGHQVGSAQCSVYPFHSLSVKSCCFLSMF